MEYFRKCLTGLTVNLILIQFQAKPTANGQVPTEQANANSPNLLLSSQSQSSVSLSVSDSRHSQSSQQLSQQVTSDLSRSITFKYFQIKNGRTL
jgi:hypothetical protein